MCFQVLSQRFNRAGTFVPFHRAPSTVLLASVVDYLPLKWLDRGQRSMCGPIVVAVVGLWPPGGVGGDPHHFFFLMGMLTVCVVYLC